ncbi:MAG: prepilin-type N-terminal cleavage/methylation domain-containing protein [Planctomycetes bacterium]|nr:prepilin-type N-terminal cleavage/methylation domain-containing protein [Planctomycetota bacterium]
MRVSLWKQRWEGECPVGRRPGNAFTLVELLVVIAIISLLASLLAPALQSAVAKAKIVKCLGNQKQIAMGLDMYAADCRQRYPYAWGYTGDLPYHFWHRTLLIGGYLGREYNDESETYDIAKRGETVLICPEDANPKSQGTGPAATDFLSYGMNVVLALTNDRAKSYYGHYIRKNRIKMGGECGKPQCRKWGE